jgi:hypothetical protein
VQIVIEADEMVAIGDSPHAPGDSVVAPGHGRHLHAPYVRSAANADDASATAGRTICPYPGEPTISP